MFKKYKFNLGLTLLVQSASFVILFFMLYNKKKSVANALLALSAVGGLAGAYLVLKEARNEVEACDRAAKEACDEELEDNFAFDECENCYGDCSECIGRPKEATECEITVEDGDDEAVDEAISQAGVAPDVTEAPLSEEAVSDVADILAKDDITPDTATENA